MEFRRLVQDEIVNLLDDTREIITQFSGTAQQSKDTIGLEMRYNEFTSKYRNSETGRIDINQIQEDFLKGDKDCLDMYAYMEKHVEKAKSQIEKAESQIIEGKPEQVTLIVEKGVEQTFEIENSTKEIPLEIDYRPLEVDLDDITKGLEIKDPFASFGNISRVGKVAMGESMQSNSTVGAKQEVRETQIGG